MDVFAKNGRRQIASLTSDERGGVLTVIAAMSASRQFIPPLNLSSGRIFSQLMMGWPPVANGAAHPSGWMKAHLSCQWYTLVVQKV